MTKNEGRVTRLEEQAGTTGEPWVVVVWSDDQLVEVNGEFLTVEEVRARFPDLRVVEWQDEPGTS